MSAQAPFILLVEDDVQLRKIEKRFLTSAGYVVLEAGSFTEAIDRITIKPSLVILDIDLPDASGWEVAKWLERQTARVPVLVVSGVPLDVKQWGRVQPAACLRKPFAMADLFSLVQEHITSPDGA